MAPKVGDYSYPQDYTPAFESKTTGNRIINIRIYGKEKEHILPGGTLFQTDAIMEVRSFPEHTVLFTSTVEGKKLKAITLPPNMPAHYAITPKEVKAVFIEVNKSSDPNAEEGKWEADPEVAKFEQNCWTVTLRNKNKLSMKDKEGYVVGDLALKIYQYVNGKREEVKPKECHYPSYYLEPNHDYEFEGGQTFFLRQV